MEAYPNLRAWKPGQSRSTASFRWRGQDHGEFWELGVGLFSSAFKFQNSLVTKGQIQRSFSNSPMKKPSVANGGEIALSISISCEANFSFLLLDHVLGCRRSGS